MTIFATATFGGSNGTELALAGWRPAPDLGWLRPEHPPRPAFTQSHGYFPLAFCTRFTVSPP